MVKKNEAAGFAVSFFLLIDESTGLRADKIIELTIVKSKKLYPEKLRLIEYYDAEKDNYLVFMTNNFEGSALDVSYIYKNRWQIETFFKWIKQNLVIKKLWGHSQNAVKTHIWTAICTYLIVSYVKKNCKKRIVNLSDYANFKHICF